MGPVWGPMTNKMGKMANKMGQLGPKKPTDPGRGQRRPARKADRAGPLEGIFKKGF